MDYMYMFILMILNIKIDVKYIKLLNVKKGEYMDLKSDKINICMIFWIKYFYILDIILCIFYGKDILRILINYIIVFLKNFFFVCLVLCRVIICVDYDVLNWS